jgi:nucleoside-diphosphate-sugar epimerase
MAVQKRALVVGGTGPTGPYVVNGLLSRGYEVAIFHRGTHESDQIPSQVEHIHGDPHFAETITEALGEREFELVVAMYGRTRLIARRLVGRAKRFIAVGSVAATKGHFAPESLSPEGLPVPTSESAAAVSGEHDPDGRFAWRIAETEREIISLHPSATILRYPIIYGPHQVLPFEWGLIRRALDRRPYVILPDAGLRIITRGYAENMAHAVLCAVDQPDKANGQIFNCADERQLTLHELAEVVADAVGHNWEVVSVPAKVARPSWPMIYTDPQGSWHRLYDIFKLKTELGYRDVVGAVDAVARTVKWYVERRDELAADIEARLKDPFDYALEDDLAADWRQMYCVLLERYGLKHTQQAHPYAHPKSPGQKRDHLGR